MEYLSDYDVPVDAMVFQHFTDDDRTYLARNHTGVAVPNARRRSSSGGSTEWDGRSWYINVGGALERDWADMRRHGFVSAGGGPVYASQIRKLAGDGTVYAYLSGKGYVGAGTILQEARLFTETTIGDDNDERLLHTLPLEGSYDHGDGEPEWAVTVQWHDTRSPEQAFKESGLFTYPHTACRLKQAHTLRRLAEVFEHPDDGGDD